MLGLFFAFLVNSNKDFHTSFYVIKLYFGQIVLFIDKICSLRKNV